MTIKRNKNKNKNKKRNVRARGGRGFAICGTYLRIGGIKLKKRHFSLLKMKILINFARNFKQ